MRRQANRRVWQVYPICNKKSLTMKHFYSRFFLSLLLCCIGSFSEAQTADFSSDVTSGCNPLVVSFKNKSAGTITSYYWEFGDSKTSTLKDPSTTYIAAGTYTVKLTVRNGSGAPSTKTSTIIVYPSPTPKFTASPVSGCPCTEVNFVNTSVANSPGAITSIWSFGDGYTATTNNSRHLYCIPGSYNVALKVTNSVGCITTKVDTAKVMIFEKPVIDFIASKTKLCKRPDSVNFTCSVLKGKSPYTYNWSFGDGVGTSTAANPSYTYTMAGNFTVRLIVTDANGCKDTLTKTDYILSYLTNSDFKIPASFCPGNTLVAFENTSKPAPLDTKWIWGDGGTSSAFTPSRYFWKGGTQTVTMINTFGPGCVDTVIKSYTTYPKPRTSFSYTPIYPCPAPVTVHFENKSNGADSFKWIFGDGSSSLLKNPSHTYTWDSVFTVYLIGKNSYGCIDTFRVRDTSKPFPGGYPTSFYDSFNSPIIVRVFSEYTVVRKFHDSSCIPATVKFSAELHTNTHLPSVIDTAKITAACGTIAGYYAPYWPCSLVSTFTDPYPDMYYDNINPGTGFPFLYPYPARRYFWDFGDGGTSTATFPSHTYTAEGKYKIRVTIWTDSCEFSDSIEFEAGNKPIANFSFDPDTICKYDIVNFTNLSIGGTSYSWSFGDGLYENDTVKYLSHRYMAAGYLKILLMATRLGCHDTISKPIVVNPPSANFGMKYSCDTILKVKFLDSSYRATRWIWHFGDGDTSTLRNPIHIYADTGVYTVTLYTYNDSFSCKDSLQRQVQLYDVHPYFSATDTNVCLGDTIWLEHTKPNYLVDFWWKTSKDSVLLDTIKNQYFVLFKDTGIYSITHYSINSHFCIDSHVRNNYLGVAKPQMKLKATPLISCFPTTIDFTDSSFNTKGKGIANITRKFTWGDATTFTGSSPTASKNYSSPGSYIVKLLTTDNVGCKDSTNITVELRKPVAAFTSAIDTFTCMFKAAKFNSTSVGVSLSYLWDFGDGGASTDANPSHIFTSLGSFNIKLVVTDASGCKDSITKLAYIKTTKPTASFIVSDSFSLCPPMFVTFTNTSSPDVVKHKWDFDNGSTATIPAPVTPYMDSGKYQISLIVTDKYGCTDTAYKTVRVMGYDGALSYNNLNGCVPHLVEFEAELINVDVMVWDFADGVTESAKGKLKTTHIYTEPGLYVPRLILGDGKGCATSSRGLDTIRVDGIFTTISTSPACVGTEVTFNDSSYSFLSDYANSEWTFEDGSTFSGKNPKRTYSEAGTYPIKLISTNTNGCIDTLISKIVIHPLPQIKGIDTIICLGDKVILQARGGVSYTWLPDTTLSCFDCDNPEANTREPRKYFVTGTDIYGCKNSDIVEIGIKTKTTLVLTEDTELCAKTPIQLYASGAHKYYWSPSTFLNDATIANPTATLDSTIVYRVIGIEGSCIPDTGFIKVLVHPLPIVNAGADQRVLAGTEVQLNGTGQYIKEYLWSPAQNLSCSSCSNPTTKPTTTTLFTLKATSEYGCSDSDDVVVHIFCDQSQLFLPNSFTPNGDGQNDYFYPQGQGVAKIKSFIVYNRWGQKVYERTSMDANTREQGWDGTYQGDILGSDTFVYTLEAICDNGEAVFWKGDITLIR